MAEIRAHLESLPDIKRAVETLSCSMTTFREEYVVEHSKLSSSTQRAHERLDVLAKEVDVLEHSMEEVMKILPLMRAISYVGIGLSVPLITGILVWIWQLITHGGLILP